MIIITTWRLLWSGPVRLPLLVPEFERVIPKLPACLAAAAGNLCMSRTLSHFTTMFDWLSVQLAILQIPYLLARDLWSPFLTLPLAYLSNFDASYYYRYCALLRSPEVQGKEIGFCQITLSFPLSFPPLSYRTSSGFYNAESNIQNTTSGSGRKKEFVNKTLATFFYISYNILYMPLCAPTWCSSLRQILAARSPHGPW